MIFDLANMKTILDRIPMLTKTRHRVKILNSLVTPIDELPPLFQDFFDLLHFPGLIPFLEKSHSMEPLKASASLSSSSSKPISGWTYDVFLSFRGEDTRNNFVDHLYAALVQKGIHAFKDDQMIRRGKLVSSEILQGIEESRFAIVVFSKDYAKSSWCLEELAKIMECEDQKRQKVLPVFYHVDPSDVRRQKRDYATAFEQQEEKYKGEMDKLNKWRKALAAAANISGFHISTTSGGESATINEIVQEILGDKQPRGRENNLIGIEHHMDVLNSLLSVEAIDKVLIVGIFGMGGIGKTTISRALFSRIAYKFEGSSFINDVRENSSSKRDICALQEKILRDILVAHKGFTIQDPEHGAYMMQDRFCNKKVLLVLDDVDNVKQLEFLAGANHWFGPGSRIVITTRDEHVLSDANAKYKPSLLRMDQAVELFSRHAFRKSIPPHEYEDLSSRAICYAGRLPLALKVLGSFFRGRKADVWGSALDRLAKTPNSEIFEALKLSFDGLEEYEKKIFLDVACFFKGREINDVTRLLDSFGFYARIGITSLIEKSLITISKNRLNMHDLIQEMGWQMLRESAPHSRLWKKEEIHDRIKKNEKLELIEAIVNPLQYNVVSTQGFSADIFKSMKNLRLLDVNQNFTCCEPTFLPHELRWLRWNQYPFSSLPIANMHKLVGIEVGLYGKVQYLWNGQKIMMNLKFIQLEALDCLSRFPDVSGTPNIERLILSRCTNLVEVHDSLGFLKRLVHLDMNKCWNLKHLPSKFEMESLEALILSSCYSLSRLPEFSPCMVKLSHINCLECYGIEELPSSIKYVSNLNILNLTRCTRLSRIPNSISQLKCLKSLVLDNCSKLQRFPAWLGRMGELLLAHSNNFHWLPSLHSLKKLDLSWNQIGDLEFPKNLDGLFSLEELSLRGNSKLRQLPANISHLSRLKHLDLSNCQRLQNFYGLPSALEVLNASDCVSLKRIRDLAKEYECLHNICLFGCKKLLKDTESEKHLDNMFKQSFLMKCAAMHASASVGIPGCNIPSWFKEQQDGNNISLKLRAKWPTEIIGFAICGVFRRLPQLVYPCIKFSFENYKNFGSMLEVDCKTVSSALKDANLWITYVPFSLLEKMRDNDDDVCEFEGWSHTIEGKLAIDLSSADVKAIRCGAQVVYKGDVESTKQIIKPSVSFSYYWNWNLRHGPQNTILCS